MKHLNLITLALLILLTAALQGKAQQFTLTGKITGEPNAYIFLKYINDKGETVKDSCSLKNGDFSFKGNINGPTRAYFPAFVGRFRVRDDRDPNSTFIFLEPGNIVANGTYGYLKELKVTGSASHDEFLASSKLPLAKQIGNPNSVVSAHDLTFYKSRIPVDSLEYLYEKMAPNVKESNYGKEIKAYIMEISKVSAGKLAKNFTGVDLNGKRISLADFKGKYVLLDFWGSWCAPCREAVPHLKQLFTKYNKMGLEVLAIAVNDKPKNWKDAIKQDGTSIWHNIMDIKNADNEVEINDEFNVHTYPSKILIDKNGVIVQRYIGSDSSGALDKKLAEIFKTN